MGTLLSQKTTKEKEKLMDEKICNASKWVVVGFMGSGKSYFTQKIKDIFPFVDDLDELIEQEGGKPISKIIQEEGLEAFRILEAKTLENYIKKTSNFMLSLGGGALYEKTKRLLDQNNVKIILIDTPFELCYERIKNCSNRPLAQRSKEELYKLYKERQPFYQKADVTFTIKPNAHSEEIKELLLNRGIRA